MKKPVQYKETPKIRKQRVNNQKALYTRVVENKKVYNRKKVKEEIRNEQKERG